MPRPTRFLIEGYDSRNWGDVLMATASANLANEIDPDGEILFARELPYTPSNSRQIFEQVNVNSNYGGKPAWNVFFKAKGPFDVSYRARQAKRGDVLLFCNGYIFGDPWPTKWLLRLSRAFARLHARGVKIVLMPQSFGPFAQFERKAIFDKIFRSTALVLTRDGQSSDYLAEAGFVGPNFIQSIDYTGMLNDNPAFSVKASRPKRLCVIPNVKIREKYGDGTAARYMDLLASLIRQAQSEHGLEVVVVHHTAGKDEDLIQSLISQSGANIAVHKEDPLETRRLIGQSGLVISSRFHGVMNGLSQNVPVISLGWSHKYSELMKHYGMERFSLIGDRFDAVPDMLRTIVAEHSDIVEGLGAVNATATHQYYQDVRRHLMDAVSHTHS